MAMKPFALAHFSKNTAAYLAEMGPKPPKFPTFEELLGLELQPLPTQKHTGLLYELLGGSPTPIYNDAQAHPEKYTPEETALLEVIISRGPVQRGNLTCGCPSEHWDLSEVERQCLDQMTLTFATADRIKPAAVPHRRAPTKKLEKQAMPSMEALPAFWWLKK